MFKHNYNVYEAVFSERLTKALCISRCSLYYTCHLQGTSYY